MAKPRYQIAAGLRAREFSGSLPIALSRRATFTEIRCRDADALCLLEVAD